MSASKSERCHHIKSNGVQCGSPALRGQRLCYFHRAWRPMTLFPSKFMLPVLEDAASVQLAITRVIALTLDMVIDQKMATTVLYALQIASCNLKRMSQEIPQPQDVAVDVAPEELAEAIFDPEHRDECIPTWQEGEVRTDREDRLAPSSAKKHPQPVLPVGTIQACVANSRQGRAPRRLPAPMNFDTKVLEASR